VKSFDLIYQQAIRRKGSESKLRELLPQVQKPEKIAELDESRFLAEMSRCLFQAGFVWRVIDQKWPGFEEVFHGFDPNIILGLQADEWEEIGKDARIVRKQQNIRAVRANAQFIEDIALEYGSFSHFIADWPVSNLVGLFTVLKKRGSRLGGNTGPRFLRNIGKDTFVLAPDVVRCLQICGVEISDNPSSKRDLARMQETFNRWHEQTQLPYTHLSKIAAFSIG
jgi:3-methyladenine DNA glycosylase Tag